MLIIPQCNVFVTWVIIYLLFFRYFCRVERQKELFIIMKTSELIRLLSRKGCELERHGGRHDKWVNRKTGKSEWIPRHAAEVPKGLAEKIMKKLVGE